MGQYICIHVCVYVYMYICIYACMCVHMCSKLLCAQRGICTHMMAYMSEHVFACICLSTCIKMTHLETRCPPPGQLRGKQRLTSGALSIPASLLERRVAAAAWAEGALAFSIFTALALPSALCSAGAAGCWRECAIHRPPKAPRFAKKSDPTKQMHVNL